MSVRQRTVQVTLILATVMLGGCGLFGTTRVTVTGALADAGQSASRGSGRSLASAATTIAALPVAANGLAAEPDVETTTADDGAFSFEVTPAPDASQHLFLAYDESLGVGVYLPATDPATIYEVLGTDESALLLQAQRDNFLLKNQNTFLNRDAPIVIEFANNLNGTGNLVQDVWTEAADFETLATPSYELIVSIPDGFPDLAQQLEDRTIDLEITPPEAITGLETGPAGPNDPITVADEDTSAPDPASLRYVLSGSPPQGVWPVAVAGEAVAAYDFALASYFNEAGRLQYFVPEVRLEVATDGLVETVEIRWTYYDPVQDSYEIVPGITDTLPLFDTGWRLDLKANDSDITIENSVVGTPATPPAQVYFLPAPAGELELSAVVIRTDVADVYTEYAFQF